MNNKPSGKFRIENTTNLSLAFFCLFITASAWSADISMYKVQGIISTTAQRDFFTNSSAYFTVWVSNKLWRIDIYSQYGIIADIKPVKYTKIPESLKDLPDGAIPAIETDVISAGTDGQDVFITLRGTVNYFTNTVAHRAVIQSKPMPCLDYEKYPYTQMLWLAFASSAFFDAVVTNPFTIDSPFLNTFDEDPDHVTGTFLNQGEFRLPKTLSFIDPGYNVVGGGRYPRPIPYNQGFKIAAYAVTHAIETNGLSLPIGFVLRSFAPKYPGGKSTNDLETRIVCSCVVTNIVFNSDMTNFVPTFPAHAAKEPVYVYDSRASQQPYEYTANKWLPIEQIKNSTKFQAWFAHTGGRRPVFSPVKESALKIQAQLAVGTQFPDFNEKDVNGKPLSITDYKGKLTLIDFWATWCPPCRGEIPDVVATYKKYHDRGFEIVGVSLDSDKQRLLDFTAQNGMKWQQYFDGQGWGNKLAVKYGIHAIPMTYLLDGSGRIIGKDLRGKDLTDTVASAVAGQ